MSWKNHCRRLWENSTNFSPQLVAGGELKGGECTTEWEPFCWMPRPFKNGQRGEAKPCAWWALNADMAVGVRLLMEAIERHQKDICLLRG